MVTFDDRWDGALQESRALVTPTGRTPAPRQVLKTRKGRNVTLASAIIMFIHCHGHFSLSPSSSPWPKSCAHGFPGAWYYILVANGLPSPTHININQSLHYQEDNILGIHTIYHYLQVQHHLSNFKAWNLSNVLHQ